MKYETIEVTADRATFKDISNPAIVTENSLEGSIYFFAPLIEILNQIRISEAE